MILFNLVLIFSSDQQAEVGWPPNTACSTKTSVRSRQDWSTISVDSTSGSAFPATDSGKTNLRRNLRMSSFHRNRSNRECRTRYFRTSPGWSCSCTACWRPEKDYSKLCLRASTIRDRTSNSRFPPELTISESSAEKSEFLWLTCFGRISICIHRYSAGFCSLPIWWIAELKKNRCRSRWPRPPRSPACCRSCGSRSDADFRLTFLLKIKIENN